MGHTGQGDFKSGEQVKKDSLAVTGQRRGRGEATDLVHSRLLLMAQQLGPNARLPRLRALCDEFGVSPGTVNLALDKLEQQRVLIRRERSGVFVAPRIRQRNVCAICAPDFFLRGNLSPFWQLLLKRIEHMASERETRLTVSLSHSFPHHLHNEPGEDATPLPDYLQTEITSGNFDGIISIGLPHTTTRWIEARGVPVVAFAGAARFMVFTSRNALIEAGLQGLAEAGCRSIEYWYPEVDHSPTDRAYHESVFQRAAVESGLAHYRIIRLEDVGNRATVGDGPEIQTGWKFAQARFSPATPIPQPDGILIPDDMMTLGVLMALPHLGIALGRDVQIATYANAGSPVLLGWRDRLYCVEYDVGELVEKLYETLEALMDQESAVGGYIPPLPYDQPEQASPESLTEYTRLVRPRLVRPSPLSLSPSL